MTTRGAVFAPAKISTVGATTMNDHTPHPLSGHQRPGLNNINEGLANTLDGITKGIAEVFGDLGKGLIDFLNRLTGDKDKEPTQAEKREAYADVKTWRELEADEDKRRALDDAANHIKGQFKPAEQGAERDGDPYQVKDNPTERERVIPVPQHIRELPDYEAILTRQREIAAQEMARYQGLVSQARLEAAEGREERAEQRDRFEARQDPATPGIEQGDPDPYAQAARELDAKPLQQGQEAEGEVIEVKQAGGQNYYVIEQDGERLAVPAGEKPEYRAGDEITATRNPEGIEVGESYGYGR